MLIQTEGIVLRQIKITGGRRMIRIFTKNYGKISAGTNMSEGGKNKTALALRPFTYGKYELFKGRDYYSLQGAETIKSYYSFGEDIDKYMAASFALELTDKVLEDEAAMPKLFLYLSDFFQALEDRKSAFETLVIAYEVKLLLLQGLCASEGLKSKAHADIIEILKYFENHSFQDLGNLALKPEMEKDCKSLLRDYFAQHLGVQDLKSEGFVI